MPRYSPQSQVALIAALIVALVGAGLVVVLAVGLLDGVRGVGPLLLAALAIAVFALAVRLYLVSKAIRSRAPVVEPGRQRRRRPAGPHRPRPRAKHETGLRHGRRSG